VAAAVVADLERVIRLSSRRGQKKKREKKEGRNCCHGVRSIQEIYNAL